MYEDQKYFEQDSSKSRQAELPENMLSNQSPINMDIDVYHDVTTYRNSNSNSKQPPIPKMSEEEQALKQKWEIMQQSQRARASKRSNKLLKSSSSNIIVNK